ncbi:MAG: BTB/POZ domain-containing protein [archaeon]|nr:BTB/POZ domain-containing protein [archaeon]
MSSKKASKSDLKKAKEDAKKSSKSSSKHSSKQTSKVDLKSDATPSSPTPAPIPASSSKQDLSTGSKTASHSKVPSVTNLVAASSNHAASSNELPVSGGFGLTHELSLRPDLARYTDVTFSLAGGDVLYAHSFVLNFRCPRLHDIVQKKKGPLKKGQKPKHTPVSIDFSNFHIAHVKLLDKDSLQLTLNYIYADNVNVDELAPMQVIHLAMAARTFELSRLLRLCEVRLQSCLTIENVFELLKTAHENKEKTIRDFCMDFAHRNIKEFVSHKEKLKDLGMELMQEIVDISLEDYVERPKDDSPVPDSSLVADFRRLWEATNAGNEYADAYVTLGSTRIPFHKAILAAHAKSFATIFPPSGNGDDLTEILNLCPPARSKGKDSDTPVFKLEANTFLVVIKYIYFGDIQIDPLLACNLAPFLPRFQLTSLQQVCQHTISTNIKPDTVLDILRVAYMPEYADREDIKTIKSEALSFCASHGKNIALEPLAQMDPNIAVDILKTIQKI